MTRITYEGRSYDCKEGESVLDTLLRNGENPTFSCRSGVCLVCLHRCTSGEPTPASQRALRSSLQRAGYFLPCKCVPQNDMEIAKPRAADLFGPIVVREKEMLGPDVCRVRFEPATSLYYHAGQFVNLRRPDGLTRSYSLASLPTEDELLEIHVKRMPGGAMSNWILDELAVGDELEFQGPNGRFHYVPGTQEQDLLLVANGTGAAPLAGIVRDALHVGHTGTIALFHGSRTSSGLYLHRFFSELAAKHRNFRYVACVSGPDVPEGFVAGRAHAIALARHPDLAKWRVFVAGLPQMVGHVETMALRAGAQPDAIHVDPYEGSTRSATRVAEGTSNVPSTEPDPEMWLALDDGRLLHEILDDFYGRVFEDAVLAPYFRGVTKERLVGQVFSFMRDLITGKKHYFGLRPSTAHHWMVISDEVFDHRERMMEDCLRRHGLPEHLVRRWRRHEESFRTDIVKAMPWKLVVDGVERPLDGFGEETLTVGAMCDGCHRAIEVGERVRYHLRLGLTYCTACTARSEVG